MSARRVVVVIQARMGSSRLPGKVLEDLGGEPVLAWSVERCRLARGVSEVVVATTTAATDEPIVELCRTRRWACFRGSEDDVLSRYVGAARAHRSDVVVRVTSDCPFVDPAIVESVVAPLLEQPESIDYASTGLPPLTYPVGLSAEALHADVLERADRRGRDARDREHVTFYVYTHPAEHALLRVPHGDDLSHHRWTIDTPDDLALARALVAEIGGAARLRTMRWAELVEVVRRRPDISALNAHVVQKKP
jgi:spore coat polysaccharide biosynthesis protein SpsF